ncbi:MAG: radical SAM protein [Candidatus Aminicenantes bacterium]|nr:radical SAM protein [Candidatus Aminicenantes bacterium]
MRNVYIIFLASNNLGIRRLVMPLGPLIVAGAIRKSPFFGRDDLVFICDTFREVLDKVGRHKNDRVYFLVSSMQLIRGVDRETNEAVSCVKKLKSRYPKVFSCVGGPDVSLNRDDYLACFDLVFQGEIGAVDLIEVLRSGASFFQAPPADLNAEPLDYGLLSRKKYLSGSLQTTRGCPFDCHFCNIGHIFGRGVRTLDPGVLEERLESLTKVHKGFVIFGDDSFGGGLEDKMLEYLEVIVRFQERRGFPFVFAIQTSLRTARFPEVLRMMRAAHIVAAFIGVESPSEEALTAAHKRHNLGGPLPEQVEAFVRNGIIPYLSIILGLDREAADVGLRVREFLDACRTPFLMLNLINPVIGSKFRAQAAAENRLLDHPLYFRYNLMSLKTDRPYAAIVRDYGDILNWFFNDRRLLEYCAQIEQKTKNARSLRAQEAFISGVSTVTILKLFALYVGICLKSGSPAGLLQMFKLIGRPKADVIYFLLIRGTALGLKGPMRKEGRKVRKGLKKLRAAGLYPYESDE